MTPTLRDVIEGLISDFAEGFYVALPAIVQSYDPVTQTVSAQPSVKRAIAGEDGSRILERYPVVPLCPVLWPAGGGMRLTLPLRAGDQGVLHFASCSLDRWFARGGEVDPADERRGTLTDAFFAPGGRPRANPLESAPADTMSIGNDDGPTIEISGSTIEAGGTSALALHAKLATLWNHVNALFTGGAGSAVIPVPGSLGSGTSVLKGS